MAIKKISQLEEQTGAPAADDLYVVVDISEEDLSKKTKKIRSDKIFIHQSSQVGEAVINGPAIINGAVSTNKLGDQAATVAKIDGLGAGAPDIDKIIFFDKSAGKLQYISWPALTIVDTAVVDKAQLELIVAGNMDLVKVGDGLLYFVVPAGLSGYAITKVEAHVLAASTSGTPTFQIARGRRATPTDAPTYTDVLSTLVTVDVNEFSSNYATTQPVINATAAQLLSDDILRIDCDVAGTSTKGLVIILELSK